MKLLDIVFESVVDLSEVVTKDEFVKRAQQVHKDEDGNPKYRYNNVVYKNTKIPITVTCPKHGDFKVSPDNHTRGRGCKMCGYESVSKKKRMTKDEFVKKAQQVHKDESGNPLYNYDKVNYTMGKVKVPITCPIHGDFLIAPNSHLANHGCPKCGWKRLALVKSDTKDNFVKKAEQIHKDENGNPIYGYDDVTYKNAMTKVDITCPIHGNFNMSPNAHLVGQKCPKCSLINRANLRRLTKDEFVKRAQQSNKDDNGNPLYTYDNVDYHRNDEKVNITCPIHGDFLMSPQSHLLGFGCPRCGESRGEKSIRRHLKEMNITFNSQERFDSCFSVGEKSKRCYKLPFDFFIPNIKTAIEVDGIPHFQPKFGEEQLNSTIFNDKIKNKFVKSSNQINKLIRLYYDGKNMDELISELNRLLKEKTSNKIVLSKNYPNGGWNK